MDRSVLLGCPGIDSGTRNTNATGSEFFLVDAVKGTKAAAFNHAAVAAALTTAMGKPVGRDAAALPADHVCRRQRVVLVR
jgi:hypothetical protein